MKIYKCLGNKNEMGGDLEILLFDLVINKLKHSDDAAACHYP